jgi:outer membrane protein assembly factor BamB
MKGMTSWVTPSPVFAHGLIFAASGKPGPLLAVKPGGRGEVVPLWKQDTAGPYVCSPIVYGDHLYVANEQGLLTCREARTGKLLYRERLEGKSLTSPAAGDGKIYITMESGDTFVIRAGGTFEVLARNRLDEYTVASPAISAGHLFLRSERHLCCIGSEMK